MHLEETDQLSFDFYDNKTINFEDYLKDRMYDAESALHFTEQIMTKSGLRLERILRSADLTPYDRAELRNIIDEIDSYFSKPS